VGGTTGLCLSRFAGLNLTWFPKDSRLHLSGLAGNRRLDLTGFSRDARLHSRFSSHSRLHLSRLAGNWRLDLSGFSRDAAGGLPHQGGFHRVDLFVGRQLVDLGLLLRG